MGQVIVLAPVRCREVTLMGGRAAAEEGGVRAHEAAARAKHIGFWVALSFDLRQLPECTELLHAGLELAGPDCCSPPLGARWLVRLFGAPLARADASHKVIEATSAERGVAMPWQPRTGRRSPAARQTLVFARLGRDAVAPFLGHAQVTLRIDGPREGSAAYFSDLDGRLAPRLRLAYVASSGAARAAGSPLVVWDKAPGSLVDPARRQ